MGCGGRGLVSPAPATAPAHYDLPGPAQALSALLAYLSPTGLQLLHSAVGPFPKLGWVF